MSPKQDTSRKNYNKISNQRYINQGKIIKVLNGYLAWHNFPIRLSSEGMCRGLSTVFAKYVLEGRVEEFKNILQFISGDLQPDSQSDNTINHFAVEVALTQNSTKFEKNLDGFHSMQCLEIEGLHLQSSFNFAMASTDENWADLIDTLNLQEYEPMLVGGRGHQVCVIKNQKEYIVYDPNYGFKRVKDSTALMQVLRKTLFVGYKADDPLSLYITILKDLYTEKRSFPSDIDLYEKYLRPEQASNTAFKRTMNSSLVCAAVFSDEIAINKLIEFGATNFEAAARNAIRGNNAKALRVLLPKIIDRDQCFKLFELSLENGFTDIVDVFKMYNPTLYQHWLSPDHFCHTIDIASHSGNYKLIDKLLSDHKEMAHAGGSIDDEHIAMCLFKKKHPINVIKTAIQNGDENCVRTLIDIADSSSYYLSEEEKIQYLFMAIRGNQSSVVKYLIEQLPPKAIKNLVMTTTAINKTELSILFQLKQHGMPFSIVEDGIMKTKEHQIINIGLNMTIIFRKFTDYLKELLFNTADMHISRENFFYSKKILHKEEHRPLIEMSMKKKP